jgi:hypothetical protein
MPVAATVHQLIQGLVGRGYGDADFAALLQQQADSAGLTLVSEHADVPDGLETDETEPTGHLKMTGTSRRRNQA